MLAVRIFHEQQNAPGSRQDIHHSNCAFDKTASAPFEDREHEDSCEGEDTGAGERKRMFAAFRVMNESPGFEGKREGNPARGDLRQCHAHEHQPSQHEVNAHQRTHHANQQTHVHGIPQQKIRTKDFA